MQNATGIPYNAHLLTIAPHIAIIYIAYVGLR